ncbi:MAG: hypothetical protein O2816_19360, partial [Planctomycetota bacterium]|nr:hypothetical protein [Planctomycetota bacterium]
LNNPGDVVTLEDKDGNLLARRHYLGQKDANVSLVRLTETQGGWENHGGDGVSPGRKQDGTLFTP